MTLAGTGRTRGSTAIAFGLWGLAMAEVVTAVVGAAAVGLSLSDDTNSFLVTNAAIGFSCAVAGVLIAWQRPHNAVGWLLLVGGCFQAATAAAVVPATVGLAQNWPEAVLRTIGTVAAYAWPWSIGFCLPLALLLFPDGRLPGPRWRPVLLLAFVTGPVFVLAQGSVPQGFIPGGRGVPWLVIPAYADLAPLWLAAELSNDVVLLAALVGLAVRYRRGDERLRRQLLWLILSVLAVVVLVPLWGLFHLTPVLALLLITLVPAAITIAVLRHELLDIRLVFARAVLYGLLTAAVIGSYLGLVAAAEAIQRDQAGPGGSVLATLVIAIGFNPVRVRLQRIVDRAFYGDRGDPVRAVTRLGERLSTRTDAGPGDALPLVREALRLPYAALRVEGVERAADGTPTQRLETVALTYGGGRIGELVVGTRTGEQSLGPADRAVLELLAVPLAMAVHATALSESLQRSRGEIVAAREEERRRLRRDLHDGLGPVLTGVAFAADAAGNLIRSDPDRAATLLAGLRERTTEAIDDVRRLVHELRPPALDELGLVGALRRHAEEYTGPLLVAVDAPGPLPLLPAAVEVAAYRIAMEALTNAVRHAGATRVDLLVCVDTCVDGALKVSVTDNGVDRTRWRPGVGLTSMRERAAELGGEVDAGPGDSGGRVLARLPLVNRSLPMNGSVP